MSFGRRNATGRPVCQFYLEGKCKFGDSCRNEHPGSNKNSFSAFNNGSGGTDRWPYDISADVLKADLSNERPIWPLSCYAPGRNAPKQLLEGEAEHSAEEMRVFHYLALAKGNVQESREATLSDAVNTQIQRALSDVDGAIRYVIGGKDQHPNRIDMASQPFNASSTTSSSAFGQPSQPASNVAFGQPSQAMSSFAKSSPFGGATTASPFGQQPASAATTSSPFSQQPTSNATAFGQPSNLGVSAFGKPSALGGTLAFGKPAFGQASQPAAAAAAAAQTPAFGQSGFGQAAQRPAFGQSGFGQPGTLGLSTSQPAFGQSSAFGAAANKPSPFGSNSTFGQPSAFGAAAGTGTSPFGALSGPQQTNASPFAAAAGSQQSMTAFGQPSAFAAKTATAPSPFGSASQQSNQTVSAFGQPSAFGSAGGAVAAQPQSQPQPQSATQSPFASAPSQLPAFAASTSTNTSSSDTIRRKDNTGRLIEFKGRPVQLDADTKIYTYQSNCGKMERIWFPDGPPAPVPDVEAPEAAYDGDLGATLSKLYAQVKETGIFEHGNVPEVPPRAQWVSFDF